MQNQRKSKKQKEESENVEETTADTSHINAEEQKLLEVRNEM
jgi:hypothetical protein